MYAIEHRVFVGYSDDKPVFEWQHLETHKTSRSAWNAHAEYCTSADKAMRFRVVRL